MKEAKVIIPDIHVGNMILKYLSDNRYSQADLSKRLKLPTSNISRLLKRESLTTDRLFEISMALEYNFFAAFCGEADKYGSENYTITIPESLGVNIDRRLREIRMTQTEFASHLGIARTDVTRILKKTSFETSKLVSISRILNYNFFHDFYRAIPEDGSIEDLQAHLHARLLMRFEVLQIENERLKEENHQQKERIAELMAENEQLKKSTQATES